MSTQTIWLWGLASLYMLLILSVSPKAVGIQSFFIGDDAQKREPSTLMLLASAAISWIFAKSIVNAADLSFAFGAWGGFAYALYYVSFIVAGVAFYLIRTRSNAPTFPAFLTQKYGIVGMKIFLFAAGVRLFNEVWSNTKVVGQFFGAEGSAAYWVAVALFTALTVLYTWRGGLRASIFTDAVQMLFAVVLLAIILWAIGPQLQSNWPTVSPDLTSAAMTFALLALVQSLSYPFHDPVLTDRAFITSPARMLKAFIGAALVGGGFIFLFGLVGVYGLADGFKGGNVSLAVGTALGLPLLLVFNIMMLTSAGSTLDSTFSSSAKLGAMDWIARSLADLQPQHLARARWMILAVAILGNLPLFSLYLGDKVGPAIIAATTISGTMIMGLAPLVLLSFMRTSALHFHLAFWPGFVLGLLLAFAPQVFPAALAVGSGKYALTTGVNIYGLLLCTAGFLLASLVRSLPSRA